jgi:hypothetical protein
MATVLRARVKNGRLTLDEPTTLPEGAEVELVYAPGGPDVGAAKTRFEADAGAGADPTPGSERTPTERLIEQLQRDAKG